MSHDVAHISAGMLTTEEAAEYLGVSVRTFQKFKLARVEFSRRLIRYQKSTLDAIIVARTREPAELPEAPKARPLPCRPVVRKTGLAARLSAELKRAG